MPLFGLIVIYYVVYPMTDNYFASLFWTGTPSSKSSTTFGSIARLLDSANSTLNNSISSLSHNSVDAIISTNLHNSSISNAGSHKSINSSNYHRPISPLLTSTNSSSKPKGPQEGCEVTTSWNSIHNSDSSVNTFSHQSCSSRSHSPRGHSPSRERDSYRYNSRIVSFEADNSE